MTNVATTTNGYALSADERLSLAECEAEMDEAIDAIGRAWTRFGRAIGRVNAERLYRESFSTFDEYLDEYVRPRWGISRASAYEWMKASGVLVAIEAHAVAFRVVIEPPARISHAQELARLPVTQQAPALIEAREVASANGRTEPTRYEVQRVVTHRLGEPAPRSSAEQMHAREQRALCDHIRRLWPRIDEDNRLALLSELANMDGGTHTDANNADD